MATLNPDTIPNTCVSLLRKRLGEGCKDDGGDFAYKRRKRDWTMVPTALDAWDMM